MRDSSRDWRGEAARRLADSKLSAAEREEIARELSGYLEDLYSDARNRGFDDYAAAQTAAAELHEDARLGPKLRRARREGIMNDRTKRLWLPALTILLASVASLTIFQIAGFSPYYPHFWSARFGSTDVWLRYSFFIYVPWLCVLPFLGGATAYWSRRAGSTRAASIVAGIFPASVFLATFVVFVPIALAADTLPPAKIFLPALAGQILSWVIIPGAALLLGVLPFLRSSEFRGRAVDA